MSTHPNGLAPSKKEPAGASPAHPSSFPGPFRTDTLSTPPHGYVRPSSPLAALCHSASVGSRLPAHLPYSQASCQLTSTMGYCAPLLSGCGGNFAPVALQNDLNC